MKQDRFQELADKFDTFYLMFNRPAEAKGKTKAYMVATHNLDTPYIQSQLASAPRYVQNALSNDNTEQVVVFSYTNNAFRVLPYSQITRLSQLSHELDKQGRRRRY